MGRQLGTFLDEDELDRPDLNKCPDCGCFFAEPYCPLCGKECPEEFRAGNRKPVRRSRRRRTENPGRVTFIEWYHSWWFIIVMLFMMPLVGIILLFTSPHSKRAKTVVIAVGLAYTILSSYSFWAMVGGLGNLFDKPVNTRLSREEYVAACEQVDVEEFYRMPDRYGTEFVAMSVTVIGKITDSEAYYSNGKYPTYYICRNAEGTCEILIRDCLQDGSYNLIVGDTVTVYGEGAGNASIYAMDGNLYDAPCLNVAYLTSLDRAV